MTPSNNLSLPACVSNPYCVEIEENVSRYSFSDMVESSPSDSLDGRSGIEEVGAFERSILAMARIVTQMHQFFEDVADEA